MARRNPRAPGFFGNDFAPTDSGLLVERFLVPPFSVLDARAGYWQDRKRAWLSLGIQSEVGRGDNLLKFSDGVNACHSGAAKNYDEHKAKKGKNGKKVKGKAYASPFHTSAAGGADPLNLQAKYAKTYGSGKPGTLGTAYKATARPGHGGTKSSAYLGKAGTGPMVPLGGGGAVPTGGTGKNSAYLVKQGGKYSSVKELGERLTWVTGQRAPYEEWTEASQKIADTQASGTSIFDPVICELAYKWFSPQGGAILDPFAGGSVRGIVANYLGRHYTGIDLRPEQCTANDAQGKLITPENVPEWICGDSLKVLPQLAKEGRQFDFVKSCPPYADLEVYSDDPRDLSTLDYPDFMKAYAEIIRLSADLLKPNRFACWMVGEVRTREKGKDGSFYGFVPDTIKAFEAAGMRLYNWAILLTAVGSLPIRVTRQFDASRKLGATHQHLLVFLKGDAKKAVAACKRPRLHKSLVG